MQSTNKKHVALHIHVFGICLAFKKGATGVMEYLENVATLRRNPELAASVGDKHGT